LGREFFWSSAKRDRAYPIASRVLSFEELYTSRDPEYCLAPPITFASKLRADAELVRRQAIDKGAIEPSSEPSADGVEDSALGEDPTSGGDQPSIDNDAFYRVLAKEAIETHPKAFESLSGEGYSWGSPVVCIKSKLPITASDPGKLAYSTGETFTLQVWAGSE
jgi:hypothetical protein